MKYITQSFGEYLADNTFSLLTGILIGGLLASLYFVNVHYDCIVNKTSQSVVIENSLEKVMKENPFRIMN